MASERGIVTGKPQELPGVLAITWEDHRRMEGLCGWLGLPLNVMRSEHRGARRYVELSLATIRFLRRSRPRAVFIQNPSLVLALVVLLPRRLLGGYRVVMDAHNEAVTPFAHAYWPVTWLMRVAQRLADATVVTNPALAGIVRQNGGRPLVLPDRLPSPPVNPKHSTSSGVMLVMVVATFAADEPIAAIIDAARELGPEFQFAVTGNSRKLPAAQHAALPPNVRLTGFLPEHEYWQLMADSDLVLDLTLKPDCLVCGAYEALALRKPMVLSGNDASRALFGDFAVFAGTHDAAGIASALREAKNDYATVAARTARGQPEFAARWDAAAQLLAAALA